jgi:Leucine-rich repeat (LRR) protein
MRGNNISVVPEEIKLLCGLEHIDLSENKIENMEGLCYLSNLEYLNLDCNKIESIPKTVCMLTKLRTLRLNENNIPDIPSEIYDLRMLREIICWKNPVEAVLEDFCVKKKMSLTVRLKIVKSYCLHKLQKQKILLNFVFMGCGPQIINTLHVKM